MATIKEIAEKAGVSIGTVDRILHDRGRYSAETAERVRRIVEELDYKPNVMARQLSRAENCRIAAILPHPFQDSGYWELPLEGMQRAQRDLESFGLVLEVHHFDRYRDGDLEALRKSLSQRTYDGLLMAPLRGSEAKALLGRLSDEIPVVFFDTDLPEIRRLGYIGQDSFGSGLLGGRLTAMAGGSGRRFLAIAPPVENTHLNNRLGGFRRSIENAGGSVELLRVTVSSDAQVRSFERQLRSALKPDVAGIFVTDASAHYVAEFLGKTRSAKDRGGETTEASEKAERVAERSTGRTTPEQTRGLRGSLHGHEGPYLGRRRPALVGYDLVPENRRWLEKGLIDFLLTQRPQEQGYRGVNVLFRKVVLGEDCPDQEFTPIDIVARENLKYLVG